MPKQIDIGDIIEIPTASGLAYAQYTHKHRSHGALIRVFDNIFKNRPSDFSEIAKGAVRFSTFFPIVSVVKRGILKVVARAEIAASNQPFPTFRNGIADPLTKKVSVWWLWDGEREWKVGDITQQQRKLPIVGVWNTAMLVERIEAGWTPSNDQS